MARKTLHAENEQLKAEIKALKARIEELEDCRFQVENFRDFLADDRIRQLLEEHPPELIYEDEDALIYDIPDRIFKSYKDETDELTSVGQVELYDDPYISALFTFDSDENQKDR